jgi:tetratricopeptide (TPR) repeat protein
MLRKIGPGGIGDTSPMGLLKSFFGQTPAKHEEKGDAFLNEKDWGRAKIEYESALIALEKASPGDEESETRIQDKLQNAKEALAREHRLTAEDLMEQEYYEDARDLFQLARELTQDPAVISAIENRMLEMTRIADRDVQADPPIRPVNHGTVLGEEDDAYFMALCGTLPKEMQAAYFSYGEPFKSGYMALNRGEFDLAVEHFLRAIERNPSPDSFIPLELGTAYLNLGNLDAARGLLETFLKHHPDALPGYQLLCEIFWEMRAFDEAEALLDRCPDELKHSFAHYLLRGETLFHAGNYSEARSLYQDVLKQYGWNEPIARALAKVFETSGDLQNARDTYAEIMDHCKSCHARIDPFIKRRFADTSFELGQHSIPVLETYLSLAQDDPENASFYYQRVSNIYAAIGNDAEARRFEAFARQGTDDQSD